MLAARDDLDAPSQLIIMHQPHCDAEVLALLARSAHPTVRFLVAQEAKTTPDVLDELAHDEDLWVVAEVARRPDCIAATLAEIATRCLTDHQGAIRALLDNPSTPDEVFELVAEAPDGH